MRILACFLVVLFSLPVHAASTSFVHLVCNIDNAEVRVDGKMIGTTPVRPIPLRPGRHVILVTHAGHTQFSKTIQLDAGVTLPLFAELVEESLDLPEMELEPLGPLVPTTPSAPEKSKTKPVVPQLEMDMEPLPDLDLPALPDVPETKPDKSVKPPPPPALQLDPSPPVATVSLGKPWYKSWWFIGATTGAAIVAGVVAGVVVGTQSDGGDDKSPVVVW